MRALITVRQVMPSRLRHRLDALHFTAISSRQGAAPTHSVSSDVPIALSTAARDHEVLGELARKIDRRCGGRISR